VPGQPPKFRLVFLKMGLDSGKLLAGPKRDRTVTRNPARILRITTQYL